MPGHRSAGCVLALALALVCAGVADAAESPQATCTARLAGRRALATVELENFFDSELLRLVRLGLTGQLDVEVSLVKKRFFLLSENESSERYQSLVSYDRSADAFRIDGRRVSGDLRRVVLDRLSVSVRDPSALGIHTVRVRARLEVITASSLLQVARWIAGREKEAAQDDEGSGFSAMLLKSLLQDLARSASGTCELSR